MDSKRNSQRDTPGGGLSIKNLQKTSLILIALLLAISFQNCNKVDFSSDTDASLAGKNNGTNPDGDGNDTGIPADIPPDIATGVPPVSCKDELLVSTESIKVLFVVDTSGSNQSNPGSDPDKSYRHGSINAFSLAYGGKSNFGWGFLTFAGNFASSLIGSLLFPELGNGSAMTNALSDFMGVNDSGGTPYRAAFDLAKSVITKDSNSSGTPAGTKYIIVFMSDGLPNPSIPDSQLRVEIKEIVDLLPGRITFNSIYYGPSNINAKGRMALLAFIGKGQFLDTNNPAAGKSFPISDTVLIPSVVCQ